MGVNTLQTLAKYKVVWCGQSLYSTLLLLSEDMLDVVRDVEEKLPLPSLHPHLPLFFLKGERKKCYLMLCLNKSW